MLYSSKSLGKIVVISWKAGNASLELKKRLYTDFTNAE